MGRIRPFSIRVISGGLAALAAAGIGWPEAAWAARANVRPFFSFRTAYNDNLQGIDTGFADPTTGEKQEALRVWQLSYAPGLSLIYYSARTSIELQYRLGFEDFFKAGDLPPGVSDDDFKELDFISHQGRLLTAREWDRLTLSLTDTILQTRRLEDIYNNTDRTNAAKTLNNQLNPAMEYRWNAKHRSNLQYRWDVLLFQDENNIEFSRDNSQGHYASFLHNYQPDSINTFTLQHIFHARHFKTTTDYRANSTAFNYVRQMPRYSLGSSLAYQHTEFDVECVGDGCGINAEQMREEDSDTTMIGTVFFRANRFQRLIWEAVGERGRNTFGTNSFYDFNRFDTRAVYLFTPKLTGSFAFTLVNNRYDNERSEFDVNDPDRLTSRTRDDWMYRYITTLSYLPTGWLTVNLEYDYRKRDSNQLAADLRNHLVYLELRIFPRELAK